MSRDIDLTGRVAVVTGGGGGIGGAVSDTLAAAGAHVVVAEIDDQRAKDRVAAITARGHSAQAVVADVRRAEEVGRLAAPAGNGAHDRGAVDRAER